VTPEEQAVIDAAIRWSNADPRWCRPVENALDEAVAALERSRQPKTELRWYLRTWADVRAGDVVRFTTARDRPAIVTAISRVNHVTPRPWSSMSVTVDTAPAHKLSFNADAEIEIEMDVRTYDAMIVLGGWTERLA
jgi:hypothetical protein